MAIYDGTFTLYELLVASKLNTMIAGINAHVHDDLYYTETEVDTKTYRVKASSGDATGDYLDSKVDASTIKVTSNKLKVGTIFGAWSGVGASGTATTDGIICAHGTTGGYIYGTGSTPSSGATKTGNQGHGTGYYGVTMFVKKGESWYTSNMSNIYWLPIGA